MDRALLIAAATGHLPVADELIPEWGGHVRFRGMTAKQRLDTQIAIRKAQADEAGDGAFERVLVDMVMCAIIDDNGAPMFTACDADRAIFGGFDARGFGKALAAVQRLNGMAPPEGDENAPLTR